VPFGWNLVQIHITLYFFLKMDSDELFVEEDFERPDYDCDHYKCVQHDLWVVNFYDAPALMEEPEWCKTRGCSFDPSKLPHGISRVEGNFEEPDGEKCMGCGWQTFFPSRRGSQNARVVLCGWCDSMSSVMCSGCKSVIGMQVAQERQIEPLRLCVACFETVWQSDQETLASTPTSVVQYKNEKAKSGRKRVEREEKKIETIQENEDEEEEANIKPERKVVRTNAVLEYEEPDGRGEKGIRRSFLEGPLNNGNIDEYQQKLLDVFNISNRNNVFLLVSYLQCTFGHDEGSWKVKTKKNEMLEEVLHLYKERLKAKNSKDKNLIGKHDTVIEYIEERRRSSIPARLLSLKVTKAIDLHLSSAIKTPSRHLQARRGRKSGWNLDDLWDEVIEPGGIDLTEKQ
jgi:hypothetical protein